MTYTRPLKRLSIVVHAANYAHETIVVGKGDSEPRGTKRRGEPVIAGFNPLKGRPFESA